MDPGWPANPPNSVVCILCKTVLRFTEGGMASFFRHLVREHTAYHNLNLLLELSLSQPEVHLLPLTPPPEQGQRPNLWGQQLQGNHEVQNAIVQQIQQVTVESTVTSVDPTAEDVVVFQEVRLEDQDQQDMLCYHNIYQIDQEPVIHGAQEDQRVVEVQEVEALEGLALRLVELDQGVGDSSSQDKLVHFNLAYKGSGSMQRQQIFQDNDFSNLDPISIVQQPVKSPHAFEPLRRTRDRILDKNNRAKIDPLLIPNRRLERSTANNLVQANPNLHLVPEDLKYLIVTTNPEREIRFLHSQRLNDQMVVDDYVMKKKKGPYVSRKGARVIAWRCVKPACTYRCLSTEGELKDKDRLHNHGPEPEEVARRQAYFRVKALASTKNGEVLPSSRLVREVVNNSEPEEKEAIRIDAMNQAARRYAKKLRRSKRSTDIPSIPGLDPNTVEVIIVNQEVEMEEGPEKVGEEEKERAEKEEEGPEQDFVDPHTSPQEVKDELAEELNEEDLLEVVVNKLKRNNQESMIKKSKNSAPSLPLRKRPMRSAAPSVFIL